MERKLVGRFPVSIGGYNQFIEKIVSAGLQGNSDYVCVGNVHMLVEASKSSAFNIIVRNAGLITPDGMPLIWSLKLLHAFDNQSSGEWIITGFN
jgi:N-acetylglucosaminyldiphosphoundecaprenol N-acetyl-beta-D-mannosaminyltransferase